MNLDKILKQTGLSKSEIAVFLACTRGFPRASNIAKSVKIKRTNIYAILNSLIKKGLIVEITSGKVKQFRAVSISRLYDHVEQRKLQLTNNSKKLDLALELIQNQFAVKKRADVQFFNGPNEVLGYYKDIHSQPGKIEIKKITNFFRYAMVGEVIDQINSQAERTYLKLKSKFIPEKMIVPDTQKSQGIINFQLSKHPHYIQFHDFCLVDFQKIPLGAQIIITPNETCLMSVTETETWAIKFLNQSVQNTFKALFAALWQQGRKLKNEDYQSRK